MPLKYASSKRQIELEYTYVKSKAYIDLVLCN
jgi:hypothetical protein